MARLKDVASVMKGTKDNEPVASEVFNRMMEKRKGVEFICTEFNEDGTVKSGRFVSREYTGQELIDKMIDNTVGMCSEYNTDGRSLIKVQMNISDKKCKLVQLRNNM